MNNDISRNEQDFEPVQPSGFGAHAGPVLRGRDADGQVYLFEVEEHHLNGGDRLHGGMMMTLASMVLGDVAGAAAARNGPDAEARVLSLNCDFVSAGAKGEQITGRAHVTRATRTVLFISGELRVGERILMSATGVYAIKNTDAGKP